MGVYFLTVHGRSLSVSDRYWIDDSEMADFTRSVKSNFGWIFAVRPIICGKVLVALSFLIATNSLMH